MEPGVGGAPPRGREQQDERPLRGLWRWGGCAAERRNDGRRRRRGRGKRGRIEPDPGRANPPHDRSTGAADPSRPWRATAARCGTGREGLVRGALWLLVALQGPPLDLQARVDRARPATGEEPTAYGRARPLIAAAAPPARNDRVALSVILPGDTVLAGAQLDVIAAAWFPRSLRTRLRRAPILTLQTPEGVWSYPGAAPSDVVASRLVRGGWMDLYVAHLVVFPLVAGRVTIPTATVEYGVPVTFSFFSREERYFLKSDSVLVTVLPLPGADRSADDRRVTAQELALEVAVQPTEARVGEPLDATATVSGVGNVALWPEPVIHWPGGVRAYPGEAAVRVGPRGGRMAGSPRVVRVGGGGGGGARGRCRRRGPRRAAAVAPGAAGTGVPRAAGEPRARSRGTRRRWPRPRTARRGRRECRGGSRDAAARSAARCPLRAARAGRCGRAVGRAHTGAQGAGGGAAREPASPAAGGAGSPGARHAASRRGTSAERRGAVRGRGTARRGGFLRGSRRGAAARRGPLVQPRRHAVSRRGGRQGDGRVDARRPVGAARAPGAAGAAVPAAARCGERPAARHRRCHARRVGAGRGRRMGGPVARGAEPPAGDRGDPARSGHRGLRRTRLA